jgi:hypothetical protein
VAQPNLDPETIEGPLRYTLKEKGIHQVEMLGMTWKPGTHTERRTIGPPFLLKERY